MTLTNTKRTATEGKPTKVKIIKCSKASYWYSNMVGEVVEVDNAAPPKDFVMWEDYINGHHTWRHLKQEDVERIKE